MKERIKGYSATELINIIHRDLQKLNEVVNFSEKKIRMLFSMLFLCTTGFLSSDHQKMLVLLLNKSDYKKDSLRVTAAKTYEREYFTNGNINNIYYVKLNAKGFEKMIEFLDEIFYGSGFDWKQEETRKILEKSWATSVQNTNIKKHSCANVSAMIYFLFNSYPKEGFLLKNLPHYNLSIEFENSMWKRKKRAKNDIISDQTMFFTKNFDVYMPFDAIEVDCDTERVNGKLYEKTVKYFELYNPYQHVDLHYIIFPDSDTMIGVKNIERTDKEEILYSYINNKSDAELNTTLIPLIEAYKQIYKGSEVVPLSSFIDWINGLQIDRKNKLELEQCFWYKILVFAENHLSTNGEVDSAAGPLTDVDTLLPALQSFREKMSITYGIVDTDIERVNKKKKSIYKMVTTKMPVYNKFDYSASALTQGMVLTCQRTSDYWENHYIIHLEFIDQQLMKTALETSKLFSSTALVSKLWRRTLIKTKNKDLLCMRNAFGITAQSQTFEYGHYNICLEYVSADMGGLVRAQKFMKIPHGVCKGTLLICLVSQDNLLANGLPVSDIYKQFLSPEARNFKMGWIENGSYNYGPYLESRVRQFSSINNLDPNDVYLPLDLTQSQEIVFLTNMELLKLSYGYVDITPWIMLPDGRRIPRKPLNRKKGHVMPNKRNVKEDSIYECVKWYDQE